jgi:hypothetical protein
VSPAHQGRMWWHEADGEPESIDFFEQLSLLEKGSPTLRNLLMRSADSHPPEV